MSATADDQAALRKAIVAIMLDGSLSEQEKALKRQALLSGKWAPPAAEGPADKAAPAAAAQAAAKASAPAAAPALAAAAAAGDGPTMLDETLKCAMCMELCVRPVTSPCQHNFCLACFNKWSAMGKKTCPTCRAGFPAKFAANPRINTALAVAIRAARNGGRRPTTKLAPRIVDADRPDEAFRTERAVRRGLANAASGRLMVSVPLDHFGPIPPEAAVDGDADACEWFPRVGAGWNDRLHCRQWGAHFPHVAGIAGQSGVGAQSVVLSGGYEDDRDEGEWFLYTGSGGRDLSGNKRVSNVQSFDQAFDKMNEALRVSCERGLPVRVVRSAKEKRSAYAPAEDGGGGPPLRYDGIYMVTRAYRKKGAQGKLVCRYLFVRCDNEPAPWSSDEVGDRPDARPWSGALPAPAAAEIRAAVGPVHAGPAVTESWWGWDGAAWGWTRPPPDSRKLGGEGTAGGSPKRLRRAAGEAERALREFKCRLCARTLADPLSTPCGHNFCKPCLTARFAGIADTTAARAPEGGGGGRSMRVRSIPKPCPACKADCADFMKGAQVNVAMAETIAKLTAAAEKARADAAALEGKKVGGGGGGEVAVVVEEEAEAEVGGEAGAPGPSSASPPAKAEAAAPAPAPSPPAEAASPPAAAPSPPAAAPSAAGALAAEFPSIDPDTIAALLADQDGDARDVRVMLGRMQKAMDAEARKAKAAAAAAGGAGLAAPAAEGGAPEPAAAKKRPASGGRSRSASAGAAKRPRSGSK